MKNKLLEQIILYVFVACIAVAIATIVRISAISLGVDSFTAFIVFIVVLGIEIVIYLSIHVVLQGLMLPWIERVLMKIPYFKNKAKVKLPTCKIIEYIVEQQPSPSLDDIRNEQIQNKTKEQEDKLNIALNYTRKSFALYLSDEHLNVLCQNVQIYISNMDVKELHSVTVKELIPIDLRHFGWNIWNFFKPRKQMDIAHFLKIVFPDVLKEAEVDSIKRHLKDDELKGIIKIQEKLVNNPLQ